MSYRTELSDRAAKDLDKMGRAMQRRVIRKLEALEVNPRDPRLSGELAGKPGLFRARVGGWRILFCIDDAKSLLSIVTIDRRGQVYKHL